MSHRQVLVVFTAHFLVIVHSQLSLGTLGGGILNAQALHTGGLHFPNADGSGPQATNLAAAIYGVAIPPGFGGFSTSENYFSGHAYNSGPQPSDLLIGTGLHTTGRGNPFLGGGDLSGAAATHGIDTVAALFGQVLPSGNEHPGFHPALIGAGESAFGASGVSSAQDLGENSSPVAVSLKFDLPTFVELPPELKFNSLPATDLPSIPKDVNSIEAAPVDIDTKPFLVQEAAPEVRSPPEEDFKLSTAQFSKIPDNSFNFDVPVRSDSGPPALDFSGPAHDDREEVRHGDPAHAAPQPVALPPKDKAPPVKASNPYLVNRPRQPSRGKLSGHANHHLPRAERLTADEPAYVVKEIQGPSYGGRLLPSSSRIDQRRYSLLPAGYKTDK